MGQDVHQPSKSSLQYVLLGGGRGGGLTLQYHNIRSLIRVKDFTQTKFVIYIFFREIAKILGSSCIYHRALAVFQELEIEVHNMDFRQGRGKLKYKILLTWNTKWKWWNI